MDKCFLFGLGHLSSVGADLSEGGGGVAAGLCVLLSFTLVRVLTGLLPCLGVFVPRPASASLTICEKKPLKCRHVTLYCRTTWSHLEHVRHSLSAVCRRLKIREAVQLRPQPGLHLVHLPANRTIRRTGENKLNKSLKEMTHMSKLNNTDRRS